MHQSRLPSLELLVFVGVPLFAESVLNREILLQFSMFKYIR